MANGFTLATQRVQRPRATSGLRPQLLSNRAGSSGAIRAPQINPNAANITYVPANIPKAVQDQTSAGIQHFMGITAQAVFKYEDRESTYLAGVATSKYNELARQAYDGSTDEDGSFIPGYSASKGAGSISSYGAYTEQLDRIFNFVTEDMEPRVKQKALIALQSSKNTYLGKAATHRSKQLVLAEQEQKYMRIKEQTASIASDPGSIYREDPIMGGMNGKAKFYSNFTSLEAADKAWFDLIQEVGEKIYLDTATRQANSPEARHSNLMDAASRATQFYTEIGAAELAASPEHATAMMGNIKRWTNESVRTYNSSMDLKLKQEEKIRKENHRLTEQEVIGQEASGQILTPTQIEEKVTAGLMEPQFARTYTKDHYGDVNKAPDPTTLESEREKIMAARRLGENYEGYNKVPNLGPKGREILRNFARDSINPDFQSRYSRGRSQIKVWTSGGKPWTRDLNEQQLDQMSLDASEELHTRLTAGGENFPDIMKDIRKRYSPPQVSLELLKPLKDGTSPKSGSELMQSLMSLKAKFSIGEITQEEFEEQKSKINRYFNALEGITKYNTEYGLEN